MTADNKVIDPPPVENKDWQRGFLDGWLAATAAGKAFKRCAALSESGQCIKKLGHDQGYGGSSSLLEHDNGIVSWY